MKQETKVEEQEEVRFDETDIDPDDIRIMPKKEGLFKKIGKKVKTFRNNHPVVSTIIESVVVFTGGVLTGVELSNYVERQIKAKVQKPLIDITPRMDIDLPDIEIPESEVIPQEEAEG